MPRRILVNIAPFLPLRHTLTYGVPDGLRGSLRPGIRVMVPVGNRPTVGLVLGFVEQQWTEQSFEIKNVLSQLDDEPVVGPELLSLIQRLAAYYLAPPGEAFRTALPAVLHGKGRPLVHLTDAGREVLASQDALLRSPDQDLSAAQHALLSALDSLGGTAPLSRLQSAKGSSAGPTVQRLVDRGLARRSLQFRRPTKTRMDLLVRLIPEVADELDLGRAPRQAQLLDLVRQAGGQVRLGLLTSRPPGARTLARKLRDKGALALDEVEVPRDPMAGQPVELERPPEKLTPEQAVAMDALGAAVERQRFAPFLLHGVTGSGKTEVYLRLIDLALKRGRTALVLVPEISLTPQLAARFRARFMNQVAVLHSGLTDAERYDQWRLIHAEAVRIVVGARSAVFAPLRRPGVIVVDEEHDGSFKQQDGVRYSARDMALLRGQAAKAVVVLGSATPSLETYHGAQEGRLQLLRMKNRATPRPLPEVEVVDLRRNRPGKDGVLSSLLASAVEKTLERGEQAILFLNRRGFSPFVMCKGCGHVFSCEHCSVSLTYHRSRDRLVCHYCGFSTHLPGACPECEASNIGLMGLGTERAEEVLRQRFPEARVQRLDRDTAQGKGLRRILNKVSRREVDILVGTQMVTKGHDFPHVTLVGVICADLGLHFPDFRAAERTFQLLTQVAGRAGRGERSGRVVIQSYNPTHPSLRWARTHNFEAFYAAEITARAELGYPPLAHLAAVLVDGPDADAVERRAHEVGRHGRAVAQALPDVSLLGPAEAPIQRLKGRTRWLLLFKARGRPAMRSLLTGLLDKVPLGNHQGVRVTVDVDPQGML